MVKLTAEPVASKERELVQANQLVDRIEEGLSVASERLFGDLDYLVGEVPKDPAFETSGTPAVGAVGTLKDHLVDVIEKVERLNELIVELGAAV